nr:hypothetical protein CFP56_65321 [Quercus suber]
MNKELLVRVKDSVEFFFVGLNAKLPKAKAVITVGWEKPPMEWAKLNSDGFAFSNLGHAGGGGVIRDHDGRWLKGYRLPRLSMCHVITWSFNLEGLIFEP